MATANITITIPPFSTAYPSDGSCPTITNCPVTNMVKDSGPNRVRVNGAGDTPPNTVFVDAPGHGEKKPVRLAFTVVDTAGANYAECGLVFNTTTSRGGSDNFPDFLVDDDGLMVTDSNGFAASYSFVLLVQNATFGVGLVDPKIVNAG